MPLTLRRLRKVLRHLLPEVVKRRLRGRFFGYRPTAAGAGWALEPRGDQVVLRADGVEATFPGSARPALAYHCLENGDSVEELSGFLAEARRGPGTLLDVGAADGLFAVLFCQAHPDNRAVAFEPSADLFDRLVETAGLNPIGGRLEAVNAAVGQTTGEAGGGLNPAGMLVLDPARPAAERVRVVRLDERLGQVKPPTVIKVDVEGYEGEVLRGAERLLAAHRPTLFLEFHLDLLEQSGERVEGLLQLLAGLGYRFETSLGAPLSAAQVTGSPNAIVRFVARAAARAG